MSLRLRLLLVIGLLLLLVITVLFGLNDRQQRETFAQIEQEMAHKELSRLLTAMDHEAQALDQWLQGWLSAAKGDKQPPQMSAELLANAELAWVAVVDQQQRFELQAAPGLLTRKARQLLEVADTPLRRALAQPPAEGRHCGLVGLEQHLYLSCRHTLPYAASDAASEGKAVIILARAFDEALLRRVESASQLLFDVKIPGRGGHVGAAIGQNLDSFAFGRAQFTISSSADFLVLNKPLLAIDGRPLADLELSVQRHVDQLGRALSDAERWYLFGVLLAAALLLMLQLDFGLLRPLRRMNRRLRRLQQQRDWQQRLPLHGRHELGQLAGHINQLLAINGEQQQIVSQLLLQDALTQLPNCRSFELRLSQLVGTNAAQQEILLLLIALDGFKAFNECCGHSLGDAALRQMARTLRKAAASWGGEAMRISGDRFALLFAKGRGLEHIQLVRQLQQAICDLALPHAGGENGQLTMSVGFSFGRSDDQQDSLYLRANAALESALRAGGNSYQSAG